MKPVSYVVAGILIAAVSVTLSGTPAAQAQSVKGEASSHGIAGGDSFGSEGSARGGNGPSETGFVASGGVAGGNPPSKNGPDVDATVTGSISASGRVATKDDVELAEEQECGSGQRTVGSCDGNASGGE
jgi:hypothetical protein